MRGHGRVSALAAGLVLTAAGCDAGPQFTEAQTLGGQEVPAETLNRGAALYGNYCASCHGKTGAGDGPAASSLAIKPRNFRDADFLYTGTEPGALPTHAELVAVIQSGKPSRGMPAWKGLRPEDLDAVAHYVKTFSPRWRDGE